MLPFAIVEFINGGGLAVVPTKWFIGPEEDECYWPPARMIMAKAVIDQQDPHTDWVTYKLTVKRKIATYETARTKLVEYEQNTDVPTESDSTENMGKGKRKKRSVLTPPLAPSNLRSAQTLPPPLSTLRSSPSLPPSSRPTLPPPLGNLRWPDVSTSHHVTTSPATPRRPIRDNMFVRILTILEEMKETQKIQGRMLQTLLQQRGNIGTTVSSTPEGFPLKTVRDVEIIEEKLENPNFMSELVEAVTDIGGGTVDEATRRMMTFLLDHGLSRQYNFVGRNGKREFKALKLYEVIYGGLKKNAMTSQITRKDAEKAVSKWLIGARDRGGNRQARQTTPQQGLQASGSSEV
ncbi:uncharacterized protein LOC124470613 [Hypomesus transpacificus]|uniref:uncharacterized protein LOC124470613 n=1 Tax=Hypomesus transpacificus TaxID=137520 RepID=UPI001F07D13D|nr:uncharacterized protein LOC124470613 [Hypomesus transpacificus]